MSDKEEAEGLDVSQHLESAYSAVAGGASGLDPHAAERIGIGARGAHPA